MVLKAEMCMSGLDECDLKWNDVTGGSLDVALLYRKISFFPCLNTETKA